jgi:hypothetical protein
MRPLLSRPPASTLRIASSNSSPPRSGVRTPAAPMCERRRNSSIGLRRRRHAARGDRERARHLHRAVEPGAISADGEAAPGRVAPPVRLDRYRPVHADQSGTTVTVHSIGVRPSLTPQSRTERPIAEAPYPDPLPAGAGRGGRTAACSRQRSQMADDDRSRQKAGQQRDGGADQGEPGVAVGAERERAEHRGDLLAAGRMRP